LTTTYTIKEFRRNCEIHENPQTAQLVSGLDLNPEPCQYDAEIAPLHCDDWYKTDTKDVKLLICLNICS
jgi:hypothetical protein